jgi:hypothetical protein
MIFVIILLALSTLIFGIYIIHLHTRLSEAITDKNNAETLTVTLKKSTTVEVSPGDTGLIYGYNLQHNRKDGTQYAFLVDFEVSIIELSEKRLKVSAIDFTSNDAWAKDPTNKPGIINFFQNQWVNRNEVEIIYDERKRRNDKLNELGI